MRKAGKKQIAVFMAAVLLVCAFPITAYADKISELEEQIQQKKEENCDKNSSHKSGANYLPPRFSFRFDDFNNPIFNL